MTSATLDTVLNVSAFVFVGFLFWLYFKAQRRPPERRDGEKGTKCDDD